MLTDGVLIMIIGSISALLGLFCKLIYSSKCTNIKCGCIEIKRDTSHEIAVNISDRNLQSSA